MGGPADDDVGVVAAGAEQAAGADVDDVAAAEGDQLGRLRGGPAGPGAAAADQERRPARRADDEQLARVGRAQIQRRPPPPVDAGPRQQRGRVAVQQDRKGRQVVQLAMREAAGPEVVDVAAGQVLPRAGMVGGVLGQRGGRCGASGQQDEKYEKSASPHGPFVILAASPAERNQCDQGMRQSGGWPRSASPSRRRWTFGSAISTASPIASSECWTGRRRRQRRRSIKWRPTRSGRLACKPSRPNAGRPCRCRRSIACPGLKRPSTACCSARMREFRSEAMCSGTFFPGPATFRTVSTTHVGLAAAAETFAGTDIVALTDAEWRRWSAGIETVHGRPPYRLEHAWWNRVASDDADVSSSNVAPEPPPVGCEDWIISAGTWSGPTSAAGHYERWRWNGSSLTFVNTGGVWIS